MTRLLLLNYICLKLACALLSFRDMSSNSIYLRIKKVSPILLFLIVSFPLQLSAQEASRLQNANGVQQRPSLLGTTIQEAYDRDVQLLYSLSDHADWLKYRFNRRLEERGAKLQIDLLLARLKLIKWATQIKENAGAVKGSDSARVAVQKIKIQKQDTSGSTQIQKNDQNSS